MSEIPVGSPQPPPGRHAAPGGWYPDPVDQRRERWWDGWQWSRDVRERQAPVAPVRSGSGPAGGATTADGVPLAGWWWRALAVVLDSIMTGLLTIPLSLPFLQTFWGVFTDYLDRSLEAARIGAPPPPQPDPTAFYTVADQLGLALVSLGVGMAWHTLFLRFRGATPGKLITGLRVVPVDRGTATGRLPWRTVLVRAATWVLPTTATWMFVVTVVDVILPLTNPRKQALHDLLARTQVVRRR
ncbi:RDD family protein [Desertihabitans brevis]|uniref:RDD family protein n=1 Tax=Desertihabitans brevis TaxID=2268447 RepID=A0A367Z0G9_9ACTN|nr:RDD family protein [Desertihabitans brevis]RCK70701.1 RDD family protein [Desertihabitans brevis]